MSGNPISADENFYKDEVCLRCGVCCGAADGHPCEHLRREDASGKYFCEIYHDRFGFHHTVDGLPFRCVTIREIIEAFGGYDCCAYVQELKKREQTRPKGENE
jgi:hypothetical protein